MIINIQRLMEELEESKVSLKQLYIDTINDFRSIIKKYKILLALSILFNVILTILMLIL